MSKKNNAIEALKTLIEINQAAYAKLNEVIVQEIFNCGSDGQRLVMYENSKIRANLIQLENLLVETSVVSPVVSAPTIAKIEEVSNAVEAIRKMSVADVAESAGLAFIKDALENASMLSSVLPGNPTTDAPSPNKKKKNN